MTKILNASITKIVILLLLVITPIQASRGDTLSEFTECLDSCDCSTIPYKYKIILWSCSSNCNYYCQQLVTNQRTAKGYEMVQFYGKWPFVAIFGIQEFFSTLFSFGNFIVNYWNFKIIYKQFVINHDDEIKTIYFQYLVLLVVSMIGWIFSIIFHIKDLSITETLDYFGAFAIILSNLNVIVVRYFELFRSDKRRVLRIWQLFLVVTYLFHILKLLNYWDYSYNMKINMVFGVLAMIFWILHNLKVSKLYRANEKLLKNSIQLIPFENKLQIKLNSILKILQINNNLKHKIILNLPIFNNLILILGIILEINDFEPWFRLIDAHSLWHLLTMIPNLIWYDWNIWDIEILKILKKN
ncbi:uncharacterized protein KGF55_002184 [Candida pseudojiufengensis]|uniref:uncharacterized protein n=1 Tax=Candida pseudojiufengensis TaxID=497109 RepID=UPI0022247C43|nr:uncharacterized protein KGF55_002184 [Candida pseudojiufengensis]KAI5964242.1 hypothetical protein KGF55_002184 [Candida pseudojiufengensis]